MGNLNAALETQKMEEEIPEVVSFLEPIGLQKYTSTFLENGIEDLETILELKDQHLDAIGVPLGYKLKILKRIKTVRQEKGMVQAPDRRPESAVSSARAASASESQRPASS